MNFVSNLIRLEKTFTSLVRILGLNSAINSACVPKYSKFAISLVYVYVQ